MNIGSYFTNLISSVLSYQVDSADAQSENMEFPAFCSAGQSNDTPPLVEIPTLDDAHAAEREKENKKNQC
jgi:hypothetical protein